MYSIGEDVYGPRYFRGFSRSRFRGLDGDLPRSMASRLVDVAPPGVLDVAFRKSIH
jgi:hypothetical protein